MSNKEPLQKVQDKPGQDQVEGDQRWLQAAVLYIQDTDSCHYNFKDGGNVQVLIYEQ